MRTIRRTRRETERLFRRLSYGHACQNETAEIIYAKRFTEGRCVVGAIIPVRKQLVARIVAVYAAQQHYHHPPLLINSRTSYSLRLAYRLRTATPKQIARVHRFAVDLSGWVWTTFSIPTVRITSTEGLIQARWKLRLFRP